MIVEGDGSDAMTRGRVTTAGDCPSCGSTLALVNVQGLAHCSECGWTG